MDTTAVGPVPGLATEVPAEPATRAPAASGRTNPAPASRRTRLRARSLLALRNPITAELLRSAMPDPKRTPVHGWESGGTAGRWHRKGDTARVVTARYRKVTME